MSIKKGGIMERGKILVSSMWTESSTKSSNPKRELFSVKSKIFLRRFEMRRILVGLMIISLLTSLFFSFGSVSFAQKKYNEAPMLAELVKAGKLPPVEQRLPEEPLVYKEGEEVLAGDIKLEIGKYGGTLRIVNPGTPGGGEWWAISREPLLTQSGLGEPGKKPRGNVFKGFDMSKDANKSIYFLP